MASVPGKTAGIIIVGDEILKGQVHDINSYFMCKRLRAIGTKVSRISVVEDSVDDIAETVKEFSSKFDVVLTSGGIGPTHDDVTYRGIASGFNEEVVCNDSLETFWSKILDTDSSDSIRAISTVPKSAKIIWANSETPFFIDSESQEVRDFPVVNVANVFVFPGVPKYLQALFPSLEKEHFQSQGCSFYTGRIYLSVHEEVLVNALNKTVAEMKDCVFGSYPVVGDDATYKTQITIEALSVDKVKAAEDYFKALISPEWLFSQDPTMSNPVYKFLQVTADTRLAATLNKSIKLVEEAFDSYSPGGVMVSFNGGKDCTVLLHIVLAVKEHKNISEPLEAVYFRPANPFPEVEQFIQDTVSRSRDLRVSEAQLQAEGSPRPNSQGVTQGQAREEPKKKVKLCTARYKIKLTSLPGPIKSALALLVAQKCNVRAIFLGTRRTDPYSKDLKYFQMTDPDWTQVMRVNPLLDWGYQDIWTFLRGIAAPYCSLYDQGYTSLGNKDNTKPNPCLLESAPDGSKRYLPAWMLANDSVERNGRT